MTCPTNLGDGRCRCADQRHIDMVTCVCGQVTALPEDLDECAGSMPYDPRVHCPECLTDCGPCQDDRVRQFQEEHGIRSMKRH